LLQDGNTRIGILPKRQKILRGVEDDLAPPQAANYGRKIDFETLRAWAPEGAVVRDNDVAAVFTNLPPILKNFHHPESLP